VSRGAPGRLALLLVDLDAAIVRVNDLRSAAMFAHTVPLPQRSAEVGVRAGALGDAAPAPR
jgi:hypothetical protein